MKGRRREKGMGKMKLLLEGRKEVGWNRRKKKGKGM